jgi:hypothetical protein
MSRTDVNWDSLGADTEADVINNTQANPWADALKALAPTIASVYSQTQLTKMNVARMQKGLAPISAEDFASNYQVPAAQVQFGMDAQTRQMLMYGAIGLLGLYFLKSKKII